MCQCALAGRKKHWKKGWKKGRKATGRQEERHVKFREFMPNKSHVGIYKTKKKNMASIGFVWLASRLVCSRSVHLAGRQLRQVGSTRKRPKQKERVFGKCHKHA